jgi:16S rRNA (uracil1498-N3)-methyltransferase
VCSRTIATFDNWESKYARYLKIIQEASEQSTRSIKAVINPVAKFESAILTLPGPSINFLAWEKEKNNLLQKSLVELIKDRSFSQISLFVGPEGGFTEDEVLFASNQGVIPMSLGQRILRSETAAIAACSISISIIESI